MATNRIQFPAARSVRMPVFRQSATGPNPREAALEHALAVRVSLPRC